MNITIDDIKKMELEETGFDFFGVRVDEHKYNVGDYANNSRQLYQDPEFDEDGELIYPKGEGIYSDYYDAGELDGTCVIEFDPEDDDSINNALGRIAMYPGSNLHVLAGYRAKEGNDRGEIVIADAKVAAVFKG